MAWLLRSFPGPMEEDADSETSTSLEKPRENSGGIREELSELRQSFAKGFLGVASYLAGDDVVPSPSPEAADRRVSSGEAPGKSELAVDLKVSANDAENARSGNEVVGLVAQEAPAGDLPMAPPRIAGIKNDLAELTDSVTSGLSHLTSALRVVTGDDLLKKIEKVVVPAPTINHLPSETGSLSAGIQERELQGAAGSSFSIVNRLGTISKFANSFLAFAGENSDEEDDDELGGSKDNAVGLTDEVLFFAHNVAAHPETWLDFPLSDSESEDGTGSDYELSPAQEEHVRALEFQSARLVALRTELCPAYMSEGRFWRIYFVLLHSRLRAEDAALLSTPQIVATRNRVIENLQKRAGNPVVVEGGEDEEAENEGSGSTQGEEADKRVTLRSEGADVGGKGGAEVSEPASMQTESREALEQAKPVGGPAVVSLTGGRSETGGARAASGTEAPDSTVPGSTTASVPATGAVVASKDAKELSSPSGQVSLDKALAPASAPVSASVVATASKDPRTGDVDDEVDDWLEDNDGDQADGEQEAAAEGEDEDEDVTFSELDEEEEDEEEEDADTDRKGSGKSANPKGAEKEVLAAAQLPITTNTGAGDDDDAKKKKKPDQGWVQLCKQGTSSGGPESSDKEAANDCDYSNESSPSSPSFRGGNRSGKGGSPSGDSTGWLKVDALEEANEEKRGHP